MDFWVLFALAAVGLGIWSVVKWRLRKQRIGELSAFAAQRGWQYEERDDSLADRYTGTPFGRGSSRRVRHVLSGQHRGRRVTAFEYSYTEGSGDNSTTYTFTVAALATPAHRPWLEVKREGLGRKLLGLIGVRDLQLESDEFNERFHVDTADAKFAYDVLHPRMMEWLIGDRRAADLGWAFRFEQGDLVTWAKGPLEIDKLMGMLDYLGEILEQVPSFVWKP
ncbi:MAG TPA: DUF3137 domain-containing protein [Actinophytocola sp.]|uniref:DUF3137 domain-containing protein n=1 Tax=Actinophytocola sp. TaxID=1872138 RepID=UPI002DDCFF29|nr:DUF3137 domain-containing protein [Actinophytocola sp.]HEV2783672.1 DUF3137 domain-containing protein [Actinophytocola sp.]